jgi:hypothetical protein
MATYQGKKVTVIRTAKQGDQGFTAGSSEQVVIRGEDGKEIAVPKKEVEED